MRKIILSINITADGFVAGPNDELDWHFPFWNSEMCDALCRLLAGADTLLLGRKTYNAFAGYWALRETDLSMAREDVVLADIMTRYTKLVVSKKLSGLSWKNSFQIRGELLDRIKTLKQQEGKNIIVLGSCSLASYLMEHDLIDNYCLWSHPIVIKRGKRLLHLPNFKHHITPSDVEEFESGVTRYCYARSN